MATEGQGTNEGGEQGGEQGGDAIAQAVEKAVSGLKGKNSELLGTNKKLAEELKKFEGIDPDKVRTMLSRFENDHDAKLIAEGKVDEVVSARTEKKIAEADRKIAEALKAAQTAEEKATKFSQRVLDNHIRAAATGLTHKAAIDDALLYARQIFSLDENGEAVQLDSEGQIILGKDGKTPFTPAEWIESMKEKKPHWFPANATGGGAMGNPNTKYTKDLSNLPPIERMNAARAKR